MSADEFSITKLMATKKNYLVDIVETDSKRIMYTGPIAVVSNLTNLTEYQVVGYAEWGYPTKLSKKTGYYLRWQLPQTIE